MRVLGLDPGTATTGYGIVEQRGTRLTHIGQGTITTPAHAHFAKRLVTIHERVAGILAEYEPDAVAIEKLYFTRNVTTGITVAQARGVIALAAAQAGKAIAEYTPLEVKNAVVGYGKASKQQVQEMVKLLLNLEEKPRPDDAADALAIAICQTHAGNTARLIEAQDR